MINRTLHAEKLGRNAFGSGLKCVPALDIEMLEHLKMVALLGESILPQLDSWLKGWHGENLKPDAEWVECKSS